MNDPKKSLNFIYLDNDKSKVNANSGQVENDERDQLIPFTFETGCKNIQILPSIEGDILSRKE